MIKPHILLSTRTAFLIALALVIGLISAVTITLVSDVYAAPAVGSGTLVAAETAAEKATREANEAASAEAARRQASPDDKLRQNACAGAEIDLVGGSCAEADSNKPTRALNGLITSIINILSLIVGIVAVIFVIIGGFKFVTSGGDSGKISSAKNSIIYAIIGLIIVALAQFIVRFVLAKATSNTVT